MLKVLLDNRIAVGGTLRYGSDLVAGLEALAQPPQVVLLGRDGGKPFTPWGARGVTSRARRDGVHLIHGLHIEVPRAPLPVISTIHDLIPLDMPATMTKPFDRFVYKRILANAFRRAAAVIVPSTMTADSLVRAGRHHSRVIVVPHGVSSDFTPLSPAEREEARVRFAGGHPYVAAMSGAKAHKNFAGLQRAAELVMGAYGVRTLVRADGVAATGEALEVIDRLSDDELRSFFGGAEVFLLPSLIEGFGLPALEAAACGTPVVCGPSAGALPYLEGGAVVADTSVPEDVTSAIGSLLDDEARRVETGRLAASAAGKLTLRLMAERTVAIYEEVVG